MPLVLALEPDLRQAEALVPILERVGAELVLARSRDDAVRALALRVPDLILVSALLSPRDEAEFTSHLQTVPDTDHLQTLSIPILAVTPASQPAKRRRFGIGRLLSKETRSAATGCAPEVFAEEIRAYLERAGELKAQAVNRIPRAPRVGTRSLQKDESPAIVDDPRPKPSDAPATVVREEDRRPEASSSYWAWDGAPVEASRPHPIPVPEPIADSASPDGETEATALAAARRGRARARGQGNGGAGVRRR